MKKLGIAIIATIGLAGIAQAEETAVVSFNDLDVNKNASLSIAETATLPGITEQWKALDLNGDGQLSEGEFTGYKAPAPAAGEAQQ